MYNEIACREIYYIYNIYNIYFLYIFKYFLNSDHIIAYRKIKEK